MHTLYAYVDGSDLDDVADPILRDLEAFVTETTWTSERPTIVDQRFPPDETVGPGDTPDWDLGLNLALREGPTDLDDVVTIVRHLLEVRARIGRDFVIGLHDSETGVGEDVFYIDRSDLDPEELRKVL